MDRQSGLGRPEADRSGCRVHVIGAGPVGLLLTALLQPLPGVSLRLYEKRREYTRTRMVRLAGYLVADSVEAYRADHFDGDNVEAVFDPPELAESLAFRQSIPPDLMALLRQWTQGFCPLNAIERSVSDLIDARDSNPVERTAASITAEDAIAMVEPGDVLIDCTGSRSLLRDHLVPGSNDGDKVKQETKGELLGDLEIIRIPLNLYRARNATSRRWATAGPSDHPFVSTPVFLAGDSAIGSPYFQSISLGFECAMFLAGLIAQAPKDMLERYELYIYKQWLRVYMQSKMIKNNKDLFQCLDDPFALLGKLHIY